MSAFATEIVQLCRACVVGNVKEVGELVTKHPAIINATDSEGFSPLLLATSYNMVSVVRVLIANKAAINQFDLAHKCSPLLLAAQCGHAEIAELLLEAKASANTRLEHVSPLILSAKKGHTAIVEALVEARANVNFVAASGMTALYAASREGFADVVDVLLAHGGGDSIEQDTDSYTPLLIAACVPCRAVSCRAVPCRV
jgi:ankyrin repeat protein